MVDVRVVDVRVVDVRVLNELRVEAEDMPMHADLCHD